MDTESRYRLLMILTDAQGMFLDSQQPTIALGYLLRQLLAFTNSHYGLIAENSLIDSSEVTDEHAAQSLLLCAQGTSDNEELGVGFQSFSVAKQGLFDQVLTERKSVYIDQPLASAHVAELPDNALELSNALFIPVYDKNMVLAVIVLANRDLGFSAELISFIEQQLQIAAHLFHAIRMQQQHQYSLDQLETSELRLKSSQQIAKIGSWERMTDGVGSDWSDEVYRIYGYEPQEVTASLTSELARVHSKDQALFLNAYRESIAGCNLDLYYRIKLPDGTIKTVHNMAEYQTDEQTGLGKLSGIIQDITGRVQTEVKLIQSETRFRSVIENIRQPIIGINKQGNILLFNPASEKCFLYQSDDMIGQKIESLMPENDASQHDTYIHNYLRTGKSKLIGQERELVAKRSDGSTFPIRLSISVMPNLKILDEHEIAFVGLVHDLTQLKMAEEIMRRSSKMDALGHMAGGIAHDFNNILNIVSGHLEILQMQSADDDKVQKRTASSLKGIDRGRQLTGKLSRLSRMDQKDNMPTNLTHAISEIRDLLVESVSGRIEMSFDLDEQLPLANLDSGNFTDTLINLCVNASDAMPDGGCVTVKTQSVEVDDDTRVPKGHYVKVTVTDTGTGIPKEILDHVFEPFYTTKPKAKGTGLGLSLAFNFVDSCQGHIYVESEVDQGTCFTLLFPVVELKSLQRKKTNNQFGVDEDFTVALSGKRVLLVDDEQPILNLLGEFLNIYGIKVTSADSGDKAYEILKNERFDLILSDIKMPGQLDGAKLAEAVLKDNPESRFIFMSGFTDNKLKDKPHLAHIPMINKPFRKKELLSEMSRTIK